MIRLLKKLPGFVWYQKDYNKSFLRADVISGITMVAMLIPQGMGYAMVAGLPAEYGLYACIIPPILYALLGTSNKLSIGPVALDSILILSGLSLLAQPGTNDYIQLAIVLTLMVGLLQLLFGLFKFGFIANFLSYPVILGYTSAASIIIMVSQLESVLGIEVEPGNPLAKLSSFIAHWQAWHWPTVIVALVGLGVLIFPKRWWPQLPYPLILIAVGMFVSGYWQFESLGIVVIDTVPAGLPDFSLPAIDMEKVTKLLPTALTVALMGYVGSMSICKAQEKPTDKIHVNTNQELLAVGFANIIGGLFRSFPVSASFSRSAAFVQSGAKSPLSGVVSSFLIIVILLFFTPVFKSYPLPKVLLATIIIKSVFGLFKYGNMKELFHQNRHEFLLMFITFCCTLIFGVQQGLLVGVALSVLRMIYYTAKPHMVELGALEGGKLYRNRNRFDGVEVREDVLIFRFDAPLYFANKDYFSQQLLDWINERPVGRLTAIIFNAESVNSVDISAILMLQKIISNMQSQGIKFYLTSAIGPVRDELMRSSLKSYLDEETMFSTIADAIEFIDKGISADSTISLQSNIEYE